MINITGSVRGDEQAILRIKKFPDDMRSRLLTAVKRLTIDLQGYIVRNKLSGQVLKRVTGTLARSIQPSWQESATGIIGIVGSRPNSSKPLKYAAIHEYGFTGTVTVKEHLRMQTMAFGKAMTPKQVTVKSHQMHMHMPERSFMRSSLKENETKIREALAKAVGETK